MADADVQGMLIRIEATTAQLRQEIARGDAAVAQSAGKIDTSLGKIDNGFDRTGANAGALQRAVSAAFTGIGLASAAAVAGLVAITTKTTNYAQEVKNLSLLSNSSVTDFQRLAAGAKTVGIEQDKLGDILKDTTDRVGEFIQRGGGEMADFFKEIAPKVGVTAKMFANLSGPEALQLYYNSLEKAGLNQAQMTTYMESMADEATALIPLLKNNGAGFKEFGDRAEKAGQILKAFEIDQLVEVNQSIKALEGSFEGATRQLVLGMLPGIQSVTDRLTTMANNGAIEALGTGIGFLADHMNVLVAIVGGKMAAAFTGYIQSLGASALASSQTTAANVAQASSAVQVATANQVAAQSAVIRAEREAIAARGTAVQTQMSIQLAEARMLERNATAQLAAAQAGLKAASGSVLALLGGPAGIAALAVGAAIAFLTLRDNTTELQKKLGDLSDPLDKLTERFDKLNRASQTVTLRELQATIADTQNKIGQMSGAMADKFENDLRNMGAAGADGLMAGLVSLPADAQAALDLVRKASKDQASGVVVDWKAVADQLRLVPGVTEEMARALESSQSPVTDLSSVLEKQQQTLAALTAETDKNTVSQNQNSAAKATASAAGEKYIADITKQLQSAQDKTFTEQASRFITENKDLTEGQVVAIKSLAAARDAQKKADDAATQSTNDSTSAAKKAATEEAGRAKALADLKTQTDIAVAAATGLSAAYLDGTDKAREFGLQQKIEETLLKTGSAARAEVIAKLTAQQDAQDQLNVSKAAYDLRNETADLIAQAKATLQGADALAAYNLKKSVTVALAGKNIEVGSKEYQQLLAANKAQQEAVKIAQQAADAGGIVDRLYPEAKLLREYTLEQDKLNAAMSLYPENAAQYQDALARLGQEYEINRSKATVWGQMTEAAVDRIDDAFAEMWKSVLSKSGNFMDTLKNSFRQFLAEMLHMAITKPIIVQLSSALGVGGISGQSSGLLSGSSGGGLSLESVWNGISGGYSVATSGFGQAVGAGWTAGEGFLGGVQGAFKAGAGTLSAGIGSLFASSGGTMVNGVYQLSASAAPATVDLIANTVTNSSTGAVTGTATGATTAASAGLSASSAVMYGIGGAIQGYLKAGVKGAVAGAGGAVAGAYAGAAIGSAIPVIGTAIGAAIGAVLGGMFGSSLFGGDWITKDEGFQLGVTGGDLDSSSFEYQKKKGGLFSSNKKRTRLTAMDPEMQEALDKTYAVTLGSVIGLFDSLDVELNDAVLDGLNVAATQISTRDKTAEQIQEELAKWFTGLGDAAVAEVNKVTGSGLDGFTLEGLTTFVNNLYSVNSSLEMIGVKMVGFNISGGRAVENLVALAGSMDALNKNMTSYYDGFTTDTQKAADTLAGVRGQFVAMGLTLPATRAAFDEAVKGLDLTSQAEREIFNSMTANAEQASAAYKILESREASYYDAFFSEAENAARSIAGITQEFKDVSVTLPETRAGYRELVEAASKDSSAAGKAMYDTLMSLNAEAASAYDILETKASNAAAASKALADTLAGNVSSAMSAVQRAVSAEQKSLTAAYNARAASLNDMAQTSQQSVADLTSVSNSLESALKSLNGTSDDAVKMLRSQAQATLQSALAIVRSGGSLSGMTGLEDALDVIGDNNTDLYSSMEDFARDQGRTANVVAELNAVTGVQLTTEQQLLRTVQDQIDAAKMQYDKEMEGLTAQLDLAQAQVDKLNGIVNSVLSVKDAIAALGAAITAATANNVAGGNYTGTAGAPSASDLNAVYNAVLGRDVDPSGAAYWAGMLGSGGVSPADLAAAIKADAVKNGELPAYATGGLIKGPGTGTSDSILARLSNGEYVMRAGAVQAYGTDFLDQINSLQIPAFAVGGPVLDVAGPVRYAAPSASTAEEGGSREEILTELRALTAAVKDQRDYQYQTTVNTGRTETHLDAIRTVGLKVLEN